MFDYFYGAEAEQFAFYRIPKVLFEAEGIREISTDAKLLYGLMLDRMQLSARNGWLDDRGRVYIYFQLDQIEEMMGCARQKAAHLLDELEKKAGLIERERVGLSRPNRIYVRNLSTMLRKSNFRKYENQTSGSVEIKLQEVRKSNPNNTYINNTEYNNTESIISISSEADKRPDRPERMDGLTEYMENEALIKKNIEYGDLIQSNPNDREAIDEIVALVTDVMTARSGTIRISGDDKPVEVVKQRFLKLDYMNILYVLDALNKNVADVKNIKAYLLATLYNAPVTVNNYYSALVKHDMANYAQTMADRNL